MLTKEEFFFLKVLENKKKWQLKVSAFHILAAFFLIIYSVILIPTYKEHGMEIFTQIIMSIVIFYFAFFAKEKLFKKEYNLVFRVFEIGFLFIATLYFFKLKILLGILLYALVTISLFFIFFIESKITSEQFIHFNGNEIHIPRLFSTFKLKITELKNIVLMPNRLTFEFKNGQILQEEIFHLYDENELELFSIYCNEKINQQ